MIQKKRLSFLKKNKKKIFSGIIHIHSTFNNTLITITDLNGNTLVWASAGSLGFRGTRKKTPYAAQLAIEKVLFETQIFSLRKVEIRVKGEGAGRETTLRSIEKTNLEITGISDITPTTHNGCRPPKRRRA
jgi:small subunit ribosomal protein S11